MRRAERWWQLLRTACCNLDSPKCGFRACLPKSPAVGEGGAVKVEPRPEAYKAAWTTLTARAGHIMEGGRHAPVTYGGLHIGVNDGIGAMSDLGEWRIPDALDLTTTLFKRLILERRSVSQDGAAGGNRRIAFPAASDGKRHGPPDESLPTRLVLRNDGAK